MINNRNGGLFTSALNAVLVFCILRFGLVFTTGFSLFNLTYIVAGGTGVVFLCVLSSKRYAGDLLRANLLFLILNILCVGIIKNSTTLEEGISTASVYFNQLIILAILWGVYLYIRHTSEKTKRLLVSVYLAAVTVSAAYTFYVGLNGHSNIIRQTAYGVYDSRFRLIYGGFDFIYGLVVVYVILLQVLMNGKGQIKKSVKTTIIILLILFALTIIVSGFSTAFALIFVVTVFIAPKKTSSKVALLGIFIFFVFVIPIPLTKFIESLPFMPKLTSKRISDLILSFSGQGSSAYLTEDGQRFDRILWTLQAFSSHPFFGVYGASSNAALGYHTEWLDQMARYGIFATIFNTSFWIVTYQRIKRHIMPGSITYKCFRSAFLVFFLLGFLNTISMVITTASLFVLCPFAETIFIKKNMEDSNDESK